MMNKSRIIIAIAALALAATYFLPLWLISLEAPQYPEGLGLEIWIDQMQGQNKGDLNKINNLNHYIGMKTINPESISELKIMPWVMRGVMLLGLVAAVVGKRKLLTLWLIVFAIVAIAGLVDYYVWGYDYGHNLDTENAIIEIPGMTYQPPLIGSKQLLNFNATSLPGSGGWIAIGSFLAGLVVWLMERRRKRSGSASTVAGTPKSALFIILAVLASCASTDPEPVHYGQDQCNYCKMNIVDERFGSEYVSEKGKVFKFDSIECLLAYHIDNEGETAGKSNSWVSTVDSPGKLMPFSEVAVFHSKNIRSPMAVGLVAYADRAQASGTSMEDAAEELSWESAMKIVQEAWFD